MKSIDNKFIYSPSDLSNYIHCKHLVSLEKEALDGKIEEPQYTNKVMLALREKGKVFEAEMLLAFKEAGKAVYSVRFLVLIRFDTFRFDFDTKNVIIFSCKVACCEFVAPCYIFICLEKPNL